MLTFTLLLAIWLGIKVFKVDIHTTLLIGVGSSICGAAAVMAVEPVIEAKPYKVSVAVATVVVYGTLSMILYPLIYPYLAINEYTYGVYVGSTIHEVAQVIAAGNAIGNESGNIAVIEKMLRVMLLAPFLMCLSFYVSKKKVNWTSGKVARYGCKYGVNKGQNIATKKLIQN